MKRLKFTYVFVIHLRVFLAMFVNIQILIEKVYLKESLSSRRKFI